jgi:flagellar biosynthetic protein FliQ
LTNRTRAGADRRLGRLAVDADLISEMGRQAIYMTIVASLPAMLTGMTVGLLVSLIQSITSVQEQTLAFVPKIIATLGVTIVALPWIVSLMLEYTIDLYMGIPFRF